tara:strand:+ start:648 stop:1151 length:504 start_codon:yes stop_codon:yes gene_type:complete
MKKISIVGPESSGKSLLANTLSKSLNCSLTEEYARQYLNNKNSYDYDDLTQIAIKQNEIIKKEIKRGGNFLIADTSLIVIEIWSKIKFNKTDSRIINLSKQEKFDYYILCKPDIPWVFDSLRENPNDRDYIFKFYLKILKKRNYNFKIVSGPHATRTLASLDFIFNN